MFLCCVLSASTVYVLLHQNVKELIWGTNPKRVVTSTTPWKFSEFTEIFTLWVMSFLLITPTFKMLENPEYHIQYFLMQLSELY